MSLAHKLKPSVPVISKKLRNASHSGMGLGTPKLAAQVVIQSKGVMPRVEYHIGSQSLASIMRAEWERALPGERVPIDALSALAAARGMEFISTAAPARVIIENKTSVMTHKHDRETRIAAAKRMAELWKDSGNGPTDGVEYQKRMRAEWQ